MPDIKLLAEAAWRRLFASNTLDEAIAYMSERGLVAPEPVDPLLLKEAEALHQAWTANFEAGGEHPDAIDLALAALRRGMEIEREKRPVPTRTAIAEAIYAVMKSRDIEEISRWHFGPIGQTHDANAIIDALQEQLK